MPGKDWSEENFPESHVLSDLPNASLGIFYVRQIRSLMEDVDSMVSVGSAWAQVKGDISTAIDNVSSTILSDMRR